MSDAPARTPPAKRRTQAERTARTRRRIVAAVVDSIAEVGLARTTAAEIERRAGVTWGAVQHHFGGKEELLLAVVEEDFAQFARALEDLPGEGLPLAERVARFVDRAFAHFRGRSHHSTYEILLNHLRRAGSEPRLDWRLTMLHAWDREWRRLFGDARIPARRHRMLQHYTISVLSGLASVLLLEGEDARPRPGELDLVKETLARELGASV